MIQARAIGRSGRGARPPLDIVKLQSSFLLLTYRCIFDGVRFGECEDSAAALAPAPRDFGFDETGAGANVGQAAPVAQLLLIRVEVAPVVFQAKQESAFVGKRQAEPDSGGGGVAADVDDGLLKDAVNLHANTGRELYALVQIFIACELVLE